MITNVEFPTETARPGEIRRLVVEGVSPISVQIKCFTKRPPPPGYKPCPECGTVAIKSGEPHLITVPNAPFKTRSGELHIFIADASEDTYELILKVSSYDAGLHLPQSKSPTSVVPGSIQDFETMVKTQAGEALHHHSKATTTPARYI